MTSALEMREKLMRMGTWEAVWMQAVCGIGLLDALGKRLERSWGQERSFWSASRD